jgi:hypothetical protein
VAVSAPASITCPRCGAVSYHPRDVAERYCGRCHDFHDGDEAPLERGELVRLAIGDWSIEAFVALASSNGRSIMLLYDGAAPIDGGLLYGSMPAMLRDDGTWIEITGETPIAITRVLRKA